MPQSWKPFIMGVVCAMLLGAAVLFGIDYHALVIKPDVPKLSSVSPGATGDAKNATYPIPADAVRIQQLPPLVILAGTVKFEGEKELVQKIAGNLARNITIVSFKASGENANKSTIKVVWTDGSVDMIPPGTANIQLSSGKYAKQIIVIGYSMHERKIFKDSPRAGTVEWEIRYEVAGE